MATKQDLEVQVLDLQRTIDEQNRELDFLRSGASPVSVGPDEGRLVALQEEYARVVDRLSQTSQENQAFGQKIGELNALIYDLSRSQSDAQKRIDELESRKTPEIERVLTAKEVYDLVHQRNIGWDQPLAVLKKS